MAYSPPKHWQHGDIPTAADMQKYSDGLDAVHAITGDAARNHAVLWSYENYDAGFAGSDYYLVHKFRYLIYRGDGELVDPSGVYSTQTLSGDGNNYIALDLDDIAWLTPGRLYQVKDCILALESLITTGTSVTVSGSSGSTTIIVGGGGTGGGMEVHALDPGTWHTGTLSWANVSKTGSNLTDLATRLHSSLGGVTADQHHNQQHVLATEAALGDDHTISGATAGHVLRASAATAAAFAELQHDDLGGVTADQHHNQQHDIVGADHTVTGAAWQVVGLTGVDTLGLLTPSYDPGAAAALLRTAADGSLNLADELLTADATQRNVWINSGTPDGSAALRVQAYANDDITVHIKQKSGQTGRLWRVSDAAGQELIVLTSQGALQSGNPGFVSGLTGWQITPEGRAEFLDGWFRGELHATVFSADEIHVMGGSILVATPGNLENDAVIDSTTVQTLAFAIDTADVGGVAAFAIDTADVGGVAAFAVEAVRNYLDVADPSIGHYQIYSVGDIIRCKPAPDFAGGGIDIYDLWVTVVGVEDMTDYFRYHVVKQSGTDTTLPAGAALAHYGQEGDGRILITSDLNYAPYMDVFTVGAEPWNGDFIPHTRLGRLDGVGVDGVGGVEQYGLIAGTDLSDNDAPYIVMSNTQVKLFKVDLEAYNGVNQTVDLSASGVFKLGTGVANPNTTALAFDPVTGALVIGNASYPGSVTVYGSITVTGGNAATQTYASGVASTAQSNAQSFATGADATVLSTAQGYADSVAGTAQGDAQDYADARRVVGMTGFYPNIPNRTHITITGASVRLGSGITKAITDVILACTDDAENFVYVDVTAASPLTAHITTSFTALGGVNVLLAVYSLPSGYTGSWTPVAGATYIGYAGIFTNAIVAAHITTGAVVADKIAANAITAEKIAAATITADKIAAGTLTATQIAVGTITADRIATVGSGITIGASGNIHSSGKDTYADTTAGFFLGYDTSAYKFDIGDANNYLRWSGAALALRTRSPLVLETTSDASHAIQFVNSAGNTAEIKFVYATGIYNNSFVFNRDVNGGGSASLQDWYNVVSAGFTNTSGGTAALNALTVNSIDFNGNPATQLLDLFTDWVGLTPGTDWSNYRSGSLAYCKMGDMVIVRGSVTRSATSSTLITTLPSGVRPQQDIDSPVYVQGATSYRGGFITIETDGQIYLGNGGAYSGNSISFLVINAVFTTRS